MNLPIIDPPVFPRWVWIEEITYSHIPIATLITALMVIAPVYEYIGYRRSDPRFERLAKGFTWFAMILFSPGAALGTGIVMWIIGTYPEFWSRWSNLFFWPLIAQFCFFMLEVFFLFFCYYLTWDRIRSKRLHIAFGFAAAFSGLLVQAVWDSLGAYMMTPGAPLPPITEPVAWSAPAFFNPSFPWLFSHRFFGNISYVMLLVGGWFAIYPMRKKTKEDQRHFSFAADLCFTVGFVAFFMMPLIGWGYAQVIGEKAPAAFHALMGGHTAPHFTVKMGFIAVMTAVGGAYLFFRHGGVATRIGLTAGIILLAGVFWFHPPIGWLGSQTAWRVAHTALPALFILLLWTVGDNWRADPERWRWLLFAAGVAATCAFLIGGFVRERSRTPDTVYGEILKPEATSSEADRFLFYEKCVECHHLSPGQIIGSGETDWSKRLATERLRPGVELTEEELYRIVRHLERETK